jgi:tetratricopeptide (TPR) repeat protein
MARTNPRELPQILQELTKEVDAIAALLDGNVQILRLAHLFNSINFMCLMRQEYDEVERNLRFTEDVLLPGLLSCEGYKHILGNFYFHRSIMSKMSDDTENERSFLMRAIEEDYGYSDYYYRVAQIYHDQGKSEARCYYEKGLSCSPFDDGVVNDYGCLLKEQGDEVALESWTRVGQGVFG